MYSLFSPSHRRSIVTEDPNMFKYEIIYDASKEQLVEDNTSQLEVARRNWSFGGFVYNELVLYVSKLLGLP